MVIAAKTLLLVVYLNFENEISCIFFIWRKCDEAGHVTMQLPPLRKRG